MDVWGLPHLNKGVSDGEFIDFVSFSCASEI